MRGGYSDGQRAGGKPAIKALPLILIAGWGHAGEAMLRLKEALGGYSIRVTSTAELWQAPPGGALPHSPGLSRYALALHNLLAPYGGCVGVIGWSMGGIVALETAREYPGLLQRLVMIGSTARFCAGNDAPPGVSATVLRAMALGLRRMPVDLMADYYAKVHAPQRVAASSKPIIQPPRDELLQGLDYLQRVDLRNGLGKIALPSLVIHGRADQIVPWQAGECLGRALAASQWCCHEGFGHALPIQAPWLPAADIRAFLGDPA